MSVFEKVLSFLGVKDEDDYYEDDYEERRDMDVAPAVAEKPRGSERQSRKRQENADARKSHLVSLPGGTSQVKVVIVEPTEFEQVKSLVDHLKNKRPVIVRLERVDRDEARRIVDFMSGATYALDGNMRKLGEIIFVFAPTTVILEGDLESTLVDMRKTR